MDLLFISQAHKQLVALPTIPVDFTAIRFDSSGKMYTKTGSNELAIVTETSSQTLTNKTITSLNANNTKITSLADGTLSTDAINLGQLNSYVPITFAGTVSQPTVTHHGNGLIDVSSCTVNLFDNQYNSGKCKTYTISQLNGYQLTAGIYYYVTVKYNNGTPIYDIITDNTLINHSNILNVLQVQWENVGSHNDVYIFSTGNYGLGLANKLSHRLIHTQRFGYESGFSLRVDASLHLILTGGILWYDCEELDLLTSINTNLTTFWHYYKSSGVWATTARNTLNNTQYNNGTNLTELTNNKYCVAWIYRSVTNDDIYVLSGEGDYSLSEAQSSNEPNKPAFITKMGYLIGKLIFKKSSTTITQYIPFLTINSQSSNAIEWGSIGGTLANQIDLQNALDLKANKDGSNWTLASQAIGDILIANGTTSYTRLAIGVNGYVLTSNGTTAVWSPSTGGMTNPMTTLGDIIYGGASGTPTRLAGNTNNAAYFLRSTASGGVATAPAWQASTGTGNIVLASTPTITTPIIDSISTSVNNINAVLWSEPTTGNITIGSGQTSGVLTIGGTAQTGNFNLATGTGALAINIGTGGTGVKTISIGTAAIANIISIGNLGNSRIGNITTPLSELHIATERTSVPRGLLSTQHSSGTDGARVMFRKSRGTYTSPIVITTADNLGRFTAGGYDGTSYIDDMAVIEFQSTGTIGTSRIPTQIIFSTATDAGPSVLTNAVVIKANQVMDYSSDVSANFLDLSIVNKKYVVDNFQAKSTNLTSLAVLSYVSASFVKMTASGTFALDTNIYLTSLTGAVLTDQTVGQTIGATGSRLTKLWVTDITVTNAISGSVTGNAGTVTGLSVTGGKTLTINNSLTLSGTDGSTLNIGTGGTLGTAAYTASSAYQASNLNLTSLAGLSYVSTSFVKMTGANTFTLDTNTYLTGNQSITISGAVSGSGTTSIITTLATNIVGASNMKGASSTQLVNGTSGNLLKSLGDGTFAWDSTSYTPTSRTLTINGTAYDLSADRSWTISAGSSEVTVAQTGHGFSVGNAIYSTGNNTYAKCLANAASTSEFVGIVTTVTDVNNFKFSPPGTVITTGVPAVVGGTVMYLDPVTSGALTSTEPSRSGYVSKPVLIVLNNASSAEVVNMRGVLVGSGANAVATVQTWPVAFNSNINIYMGSGSNTTWYAYGTLFTPDETMTVTTNSSMKWFMTSASSGYYIMAVYKYVNGGAQTLMFKSSANALGGSAAYLTASITSITDGTLVAGTWYYMVVIQNQNGPAGAGISLGGTSTVKPFRNFTQSLGNLGADGAGSAPSTITEPSGETSNGTPWMLLKL